MFETTNLILHPLTHSQLIKYTQSDGSLEAELGLVGSPHAIPPELKEALEQAILPNVADPERNYLYWTLWTIISKRDIRMVGDLCFHGEPDPEGEVEIGYGTYDDCQRKGYMTEAIGGIIAWARQQPEIKTLIANTDSTNISSLRVLEKNGFVRDGESGTLVKLRLVMSRPETRDQRD